MSRKGDDVEEKKMTDEIVEQALERLVEAKKDLGGASLKLTVFQVNKEEPSAPPVFEDLAAFLDFHRRHQEYVAALSPLESARRAAHEEYQEAASRLSGVLPRNSRLVYTYEGHRDVLRGETFFIDNQEGKITASSSSDTTRRWKTKQLSEEPDDIALDTAEIRQIFTAEKASVVHCTLPPEAMSVAASLVGTHEIWYFIKGRGRMWFKEEAEAEGTEEEVGAGTCLSIPASVHFQYRNTARDPLTFVCVTMPPFQSNEQTTMPVQPHWKEE
jgi:mannose-6-phosphate isomerase-like protein (cupin superfamily)